MNRAFPTKVNTKQYWPLATLGSPRQKLPRWSHKQKNCMLPVEDTLLPLFVFRVLSFILKNTDAKFVTELVFNYPAVRWTGLARRMFIKLAEGFLRRDIGFYREHPVFNDQEWSGHYLWWVSSKNCTDWFLKSVLKDWLARHPKTNMHFWRIRHNVRNRAHIPHPSKTFDRTPDRPEVRTAFDLRLWRPRSESWFQRFTFTDRSLVEILTLWHAVEMAKSEPMGMARLGWLFSSQPEPLST